MLFWRSGYKIRSLKEQEGEIMAEAKIDENVEIKFLDSKIVQLQKDILEMEEDLPETEQLIVNLKDAIKKKKELLETYRVRKIRVSAAMQEAKVNVL